MPRVTLLPGDGIGPEVTEQARRVLHTVDELFGLQLEMETAPIGGAAYLSHGTPLPGLTVAQCQQSQGVLLGAVGAPEFDQLPLDMRPERGLLGIRRALGVFANLRPVQVLPGMEGASPLKTEYATGVDIVIVRELTGGIYFGRPRGREITAISQRAVDTMVYTDGEIRRLVRLAFRLARQRRGRLTSVDKANVLECSRLWREVVDETAPEYPDVQVEHMLVDNAAMRLVSKAPSFDVVVTGNMFGDILSDEAAMLTGSLGMLPSASISEDGRGLYEPIHGSAPVHAGKDRANPLGTILSAALLLRHSLEHETAARAVEQAVAAVLSRGIRTADLAVPGQAPVGTAAMGEAICNQLRENQNRA